MFTRVFEYGKSVLPSAPPYSADLEQPSQSNSEGIKKAFLCPITHDVMFDPVVTIYGHTFERHALEAAISAHKTCPLTGQSLGMKDIFTNFNARDHIDEDVCAGPLARRARAEYEEGLASRRPSNPKRCSISVPSAAALTPPAEVGPSARVASHGDHPIAATAGLHVSAVNWRVYRTSDAQSRPRFWPFDDEGHPSSGSQESDVMLDGFIRRVLSPDQDKYVDYDIKARAFSVSIHENATRKTIKKLRYSNAVYGATWFACSTKLGIILSNHRAFIYDLTSRKERQIKKCDSLVTNPVNDTFAIVRDRTSTSLEIHCGNDVLITFPFDCHSPQWSPDGTKLLIGEYRKGFSIISLKHPVQIAPLPGTNGSEGLNFKWIDGHLSHRGHIFRL